MTHRKPKETKRTRPKVVLDGEEYQDLKRRVWVRQRGRCAHCSKARQLDLHHKHGRGIGGAYRQDVEDEVIGLCQECHREADKHKNSKFGVGGNDER
jgi:5-methylcytosine-specific restriction endonuclease McrA